MIEGIVFWGTIWLLVSGFLMLPLHDMTNFNHSAVWLLARTIWWPVILPIFVVKGLFYAMLFIIGVMAEIPNALSDIWRIK